MRGSFVKRRLFLSGVLLFFFGFSLPLYAAGNRVVLLGAPLFESCPMMLMAEDKVFAPLGLTCEFVPWRTPDQYRAMLASGQADFLVVSTLEYTRLMRKVKGIKLLFVVEGSPLWLLGPQTGICLNDLAGKSIALPFRGDMPELTLAMLVAGSPVNMNDIGIVSAGGAAASSQLVMTGQADYAMVPEPVATMVVAMSRNLVRTRELHHALNLDKSWQNQYPGGPALLLSNIISVGVEDRVQQLFCRHYPEYVKACRHHPQKAASLFNKYFPTLPARSVRKFLSTATMQIHGAREKEKELEAFIKIMEKVNHEIY